MASSPAKYGKFKSFISPGGTRVDTTYDASGNLTSQTLTGPAANTIERLTFASVTVTNDRVTSAGGTVPVLTSSVTLERPDGSGGWVPVQRAVYDYYTGRVAGPSDDPNGRLGDLKSVRTDNARIVGGVATWQEIDSSYYRYAKFTGEAHQSIGDAGPTNNMETTGGPAPVQYVSNISQQDRIVSSGLKTVITGESLVRLSADNPGYQSATDATIRPYVNNQFTYERWNDHVGADGTGISAQWRMSYRTGTRYRVIEELAQGEGCSCSTGQGSYQFEYIPNLRSPGMGYNSIEHNTWRMRTTEYLPSNSPGWATHDRQVTYTNEIGQPLLDVFVDVSDSASAVNSVALLGYNQIRVYTTSNTFALGDRVALTGFSRDTFNGVFTVTGSTSSYFDFYLPTNYYESSFAPQPSIGAGGAFASKVLGEWSTYIRYDDTGRQILVAQPSAVVKYDEDLAELVSVTQNNSTTYHHIGANTGFIQTFVYGTSTTASGVSAGDVDGFLKTVSVRRGVSGSDILQASYTYYAQSATSGASSYVIASQTEYASYSATDPRTTSYAYTWLAGTTQVASLSVTRPIITASQNGSGVAETDAVVFDTYGRPTWSRDADGFIHYIGYDAATGAIVQTIVDVNTGLSGLPSGRPSTWTTPPGGGLNLVTSYAVDALGRTTKLVDPDGRVTYWVYNDAAHEVRTYRGWNAATGTTTGPIEVTREDWIGGYRESFTMAATPAYVVSNGIRIPTGTELISELRSLTREILDESNRVKEVHQYFLLAGLTYAAATSTLGSAGVNYHSTKFGFDDRGRKVRTEDANGTITILVYDGRGRVTDTYVGTNDSTPNGWRWTPVTAGPNSNMTRVASYVYDGGGIGDGNLTQSVAYPGGGAANRATQYAYDWRDRMIAKKEGISVDSQGVPISEAGDVDVQRVITFLDLDNLGEVRWVRSYDGDEIPLSGFDPTANAQRLRAYTDILYDAQGRVYIQGVYSVDPSTGAVTASSLSTSYFYDHRGYNIASYSPGGLWTKSRFDGAGRLVGEAQTDGAGGSSWAQAGSLVNDHVLSETHRIYDGAGNLILVTGLDRHHDSSAVGPLVGPSSSTSSNSATSVYVSDLVFASQANAYGPIERDQSNGETNLNDGNPLTVDGITYAKGIGAHANTSIQVNLAGRYDRFRAVIGLDDEVGSYGSVVFQVWADGVKLYDSGILTGSSAAVPLDIDVSGKSQIQLIVNDAGDGYYFDHADWADARLVSFNPIPVYVSDLVFASQTNGYGPLERDQSNGETNAGDGNPITVDGTTYAKGLGVVPSSTVSVNLAGRYDRFRAVIGVDDEVGPYGSVVFQVWADGVKIYDSGTLTGISAAVAVDLDVAGKSQMQLVVTDAGDNYYYDHADWADARLIASLGAGEINARASYVAYYYDAASRLTDVVNVGTYGGVTFSRPSTAPTRSDTALVTSYGYDDAGRVASITNPRALTTRTSYDALGRATEVIANYKDGVVGANENGSDNTTRYTYNGLNQIKTVTAVLATGTAVNKVQTTTYEYVVTTAGGSAINSNSILRAIVQPDESTGLSPTSNVAAHSAIYRYNALGQVVGMTDANGTVHAYTYDVLGRQTSDSVTTLGSSAIDGSVRRLETAYDSAGRAYLFTSYDAATGGNVVNQVQRTFNGLGQLVAEYQSHSGAVNVSTTPAVRYSYTEMSGGQNNSRLVSMTYPNGRVVRYVYDPTGVDTTISRLTSINEDNNGSAGAVLESYKYLGLGTVVEKIRPVAKDKLTYVRQAGDANVNTDGGDQYTGLDRFGRVIDQNWVRTSSSAGGALTGSSTVRLQYGYDRNGNATYRRDLVNTALSELYAYDDLDRLASMKRGTPSTTIGAYSSLTSQSREQTWTLDALGNWTTVNSDGTPTTREFDAANQTTSLNGGTGSTYDNSGNTTLNQSGRTFVYDAWNRLVAVKDGSTILVAYTFDALRRRVKEVDNAPGGTTTHAYFTPDWQVVEEREGGTASSSVKRQYVLGVTNQVVLQDGYSSGSLVASSRRFAQQNANGDTMALDYQGDVQERYAYDAYGAVTIMDDALWVRSVAQSSRFRMLFQGGRIDFATGMYLFQHRDYDTTSGTWLQRDPIGSLGSGNNLYRFVDNSPIIHWDGNGLEKVEYRRRNDLRPDRRADDFLRGRGERPGWGIGFDGAGWELFSHWKSGEGSDINTLNGRWGDYMRAYKPMPSIIEEQLMKWLLKNRCGGKIDITTHADLDNGYRTGYEMLHGSNPAVGDFQIQGEAKCVGGIWQFDVRMTWNDIIDPEYKYGGDWVAIPLYLLGAQDFNVQISWDDAFDLDPARGWRPPHGGSRGPERGIGSH